MLRFFSLFLVFTLTLPPTLSGLPPDLRSGRIGDRPGGPVRPISGGPGAPCALHTPEPREADTRVGLEESLKSSPHSPKSSRIFTGLEELFWNVQLKGPRAMCLALAPHLVGLLLVAEKDGLLGLPLDGDGQPREFPGLTNPLDLVYRFGRGKRDGMLAVLEGGSSPEMTVFRVGNDKCARIQKISGLVDPVGLAFVEGFIGFNLVVLEGGKKKRLRGFDALTGVETTRKFEIPKLENPIGVAYLFSGHELAVLEGAPNNRIVIFSLAGIKSTRVISGLDHPLRMRYVPYLRQMVVLEGEPANRLRGFHALNGEESGLTISNLVDPRDVAYDLGAKKFITLDGAPLRLHSSPSTYHHKFFPRIDRSVFWTALERMKAKNPPLVISRATVAKEAGVKPYAVSRYRKENPKFAKAMDAALLTPLEVRILKAVEQIRASGRRVTFASIARETGSYESSVKRRHQANARVKQAIDAARQSAGLEENDATGPERITEPWAQFDSESRVFVQEGIALSSGLEEQLRAQGNQIVRFSIDNIPWDQATPHDLVLLAVGLEEESRLIPSNRTTPIVNLQDPFLLENLSTLAGLEELLNAALQNGGLLRIGEPEWRRPSQELQRGT